MPPSGREWDAAAYQRLASPQQQWGEKLLARLELRGDETVLDAGCGTGRVTAGLLERLPRGRVIALDLSFNMVREARQNLSRFGPRFVAVQASLTDVPLKKVLDGIFSTAVFHWIRDHERLFASLFAALKPGGWLAAQCGGGPNLKRLRERAQVIMRAPRFAPFFAGWTEPWEYPEPEVTAERLRRAGFVDVEASLESAPTKLRDADEFREFERTVTLHRHLERLPSEELQGEFLDRLATEFAADDPPFMLDYVRLNLRARKA